MLKKINKKGVTTYRRLLKITTQYWSIFLIGIIGTVVMSVVDAGFAWLIKPIINKGFIHRDLLFIRWLPVIVIIIFIIRGFSGFISDYCIYRVARNVVMELRQKLFAHLIKLPTKFYDHHSSGHLLSTIIYNVEQVAGASSDALVTILREGSLLIGLIVVMFMVDWKLSLLFLITVPVIAYIIKKCSVRLRRLSTKVQESVGEVAHIASEAIDGYKVIRLYGGQQYEDDKFVRATDGNRQRELKVVVTNSIGTSSIEILLAVPIAVILFFATTPSLGVTAGSFAAVVTSMIMLLRPMRRVTLVNSYVQKGIAGAQSIFDLLDQETEKDSGTRSLSRSNGLIEYKNVNFSYETTNQNALTDVSFRVEPGKTVAIVGHSGGGKSTLINLLPRFYELFDGEILLDNVNIRDYRLADLRRQFSLVSQQTVLFNDTIARNIAYAEAGTMNEAKIIAAAELAHAMEFIANLPQGIHTVVGEDGLLLSGGQRQRIAIARAIYRKAPILILDEATSALDTQTERHIQAALDNLIHQCTTLVIAHRLSTVEHADSIVVMDKGRVAEQGTHKELLKRGGLYASLYEAQFKDATL